MQKFHYSISICLFFFAVSACGAVSSKNWEVDKVGKKELYWFSKAIEAIESKKPEAVVSQYIKRISNKDLLFMAETGKYAYDRKVNTYIPHKIVAFNRKKMSTSQYLYAQNYSLIEGNGFENIGTSENIVKCVTEKAGNTSTANECSVAQVWSKTKMTKEQEQEFVRRYRSKLKKEDHIGRLDYMLQANDFHAANRLKSFLPPSHHGLIDARIALRQGQQNAQVYLKKVSKDLIYDHGLVHDLVVYRKNHSLHKGNAEILLKVNSGNNPYAAKLWNLKKYYIYEFVYHNLNKPNKRAEYAKAYRLAALHGLKSGVDFCDAEWLAGWIALRFLHNYSLAQQHFQVLLKNVARPLSVSRAHYWLGRAYEAMGQKGMARHSYKKASNFFHTFYGQLAIARLNNRMDFVLPNHNVSDSDYSSYYSNTFNKYAHLAMKAKKNKLASVFAGVAVDYAKSNGEVVIGIKNFMQSKNFDVALMAARRADGRGVFVPEAMYPLLRVNQKHKNKLEDAVSMAIIRQESGFDQFAQSSAGATGLMQLMPKTAQAVAQKEGIAYNKKLLFNPEYNMHLGVSYFADLLAQHNHSLVLALSAYNAGPQNTKRWVKEMGDLSGLDMDSRIDWIESIPFSETRNYVQRILENIQMYRYIASGHSKFSSLSLRLPHDIK